MGAGAGAGGYLRVHVSGKGVLGSLKEEVHVLPLGRIVVRPGPFDQGLLEVG